MVTNEPIQTRELDSLPIKPKGFQPIEFELVCIILHLAILKEQMCLFIITTMCLFRTMTLLVIIIKMTCSEMHLLMYTF
jgi:hypothetical protein